MFRACSAYTLAPVSNRIRQDVLILAGTEDHFIPFHQTADFEKALVNARSVTHTDFRSAWPWASAQIKNTARTALDQRRASYLPNRAYLECCGARLEYPRMELLSLIRGKRDARPFIHFHPGDELVAAVLGPEERCLTFFHVEPILAKRIDDVRLVRDENGVGA